MRFIKNYILPGFFILVIAGSAFAEPALELLDVVLEMQAESTHPTLAVTLGDELGWAVFEYAKGTDVTLAQAENTGRYLGVEVPPIFARTGDKKMDMNAAFDYVDVIAGPSITKQLAEDDLTLSGYFEIGLKLRLLGQLYAEKGHKSEEVKAMISAIKTLGARVDLPESLFADLSKARRKGVKPKEFARKVDFAIAKVRSHIAPEDA